MASSLNVSDWLAWTSQALLASCRDSPELRAISADDTDVSGLFLERWN